MLEKDNHTETLSLLTGVDNDKGSSEVGRVNS